MNVVMQSVLVAASDRLLYRRVFPESFHWGQAVDGEMIIGADIFRRGDNPLVFLSTLALEDRHRSVAMMMIPKISSFHIPSPVHAFLRQ